MLLLLLLACGDDTAAVDAGGRDRDSGPARIDSGARDAGSLPDARDDAGAPAGPLRVLVFSRTEGFRHDSIADGIAAIEAIGTANEWVVSATEEPSALVAALPATDVAIFLMTTGDVLDATEETAFTDWYRAGRGYVGVHSASDTEYDWPWYGELVGAYFADHPSIQDAELVRERSDHPAVAHLDARWMRRDEWYNFRTNPRANVDVLLSIDESTYSGGTMGDHPMAWSREFEGGRAFYTALGHTSESYADPDFRAHLEGAVRWAGRRK